MQNNNIFHPKIQLRPRNFGFKNIVDVKIKLLYKSEKRISEFVSYLTKNPFVSEIFSMSGNYDFSLVIIAKDAMHLGQITSDIRYRFGDIITSWDETLTTNSYKFEYYEMCSLMGHPEDNINFFS